MAFLTAAQEDRAYDKVPMGISRGKLVDITDPDTGTVRLKQDVAALDEILAGWGV